MRRKFTQQEIQLAISLYNSGKQQSVGGNQQVRKVLDWLYQDASIYLSRKFEKYQQFISYL